MRHGFALTTMVFCVIVPKNIAGTFVSLVLWLCNMRHQATFQDAFTLVIVLLLAHYLKSYDDDC